MKIITLNSVLFISLIALAALLRFTNLHTIPPGINRDEGSIGYTAYSLLKTGRDEYGRSFPLSFESFGDWKLPFYIYLTVPFVSVFGLNEIAVRLPSAIAGTLTVGVLFFLVQTLFQHRMLSFLSMFILAVSPWHIHLSRVESESNIAVFLISVALLCFFRSFTNQKLLLLSSLLFGMTYYVYHGNHVTTTLLVLGVIFFFRKELTKNATKIPASLILVLVVGIILFQTLGSADKTKISGISIFGTPGIIHSQLELPRLIHANPQSLLSRIAHSKILFTVETVTQNYLKAFSPEFLFIRGGTNHAHNIQDFGNMYLLEAPLFLLGILYLLKNRKDSKSKFMLFWLLISPLAASITKDAPHTNRMFALYPLPAIILSLGIWLAVKEISKKSYQIALIVLIGILYLANITLYIDRYFVHFPKEEAQHWGYPYKSLQTYLSLPQAQGKRVIISHPEYSPYIYLLFYGTIDPALYQRTARRYPMTDDAFTHVQAFDRYEFRDIDWNADLQPGTIVVSLTSETPTFISTSGIQKTSISLPNGISYFTVVEP